MRSKLPVKVANLSAASRRSYGIPDKWEDREIKCRRCGNTFSFTAVQQRDWYEGKQRHLCIEPALCPRCFQEHSQSRRLKSRMDYALRKLKTTPTVPAKLEAVETIIEYFQREKRGNIQSALHLVREVLRAQPGNRRASELVGLAENLQDT